MYIETAGQPDRWYNGWPWYILKPALIKAPASINNMDSVLVKAQQNLISKR